MHNFDVIPNGAERNEESLTSTEPQWLVQIPHFVRNDMFCLEIFIFTQSGSRLTIYLFIESIEQI